MQPDQNRLAGDRQCKCPTRTFMPCCPKAEGASLRPSEQEAVGVRIDVRIPVGSSEQHQHSIPLFQHPAADSATHRHESPSVLHGRVVARYLGHQVRNNHRRRLHAFNQVRFPLKRYEGIADQASGGLAGL